ncbi:hypothetical protein NWP26_05695 [Chrysosporum ovalisporum APH033B]|uniref:hypothetical protein n=1 Tax=Umezakia ovalisporum TaxID=75695 RepID=UPI002473B154|nr:hypothetical protein [Umezakia ovalisporum]MDH6066759.1 hypothetical protein [Umezakia ovalisporum APH033B]
MRYSFMHQLNTLFNTLAIAATGLIGSMTSVIAQQNVPICQPPRPGEYLLLVVSPTANSQKQLRSVLPSEIQATTCQYLTDTVTRIGGFKKMEDANRWARYVNNIVGLSAIITTTPTVAGITQAPRTQTQTISFNPQVLGDGYAVLVDYFNQPQLANSVQEVMGGNIGFASYGQRPYLLAAYTSNQREAYRTLEKLNQRGFFAVIVDGSKVMLLRSSVRL